MACDKNKMTVSVDASIAAHLPGGLPSGAFVTWRGSTGAFRERSDISRYLTEVSPVGIPLPGPDNLNAAGLLVRLAGVCGVRCHPGEGPRWYWDGGDCWVLSTYYGVVAVSPSSGKQCAAVRSGWLELFVPLMRPGGADSVAGGMSSLAAVIEWLGMLYGIAAAVGVEVPPGVVPEWSREPPDNDAWLLSAGSLEVWFSPQGAVTVPLLAGITDDVEALRVVYESLYPKGPQAWVLPSGFFNV